jgi:hypothetical protein
MPVITHIFLLDPLGLGEVLVEDGLLEGDSVSECSVVGFSSGQSAKSLGS